MKILLSFFVTFFLFILVICQNQTTTPSGPQYTDDNLNPEWSYCFEFTWVGPDYNNLTRFNYTCDEYLDSQRAKGVPCSPPIVMTIDGTPPNIDYLFENHRRSVLCKRALNQVCATYTYRYDGLVRNSTYMCTRVQQVGGSAIKSGCYHQKVGSSDIELCVCESNAGIFKPCNGKLVDYK